MLVVACTTSTITLNMSVSVERRTWWGGRRRVEDRALSAAAQTTSSPNVMLDLAAPGTVTPANALAIADVYAAVRCLSDAAASVPLIPYRRTADGRTRADGRLADLLRRPAPGATQANLIGTAMAHLQLYGNAYLGKFRDADGRVAQLGMLHPDRVSVELRAGEPIYTVNDGRGRQTEHTTSDIVHVRALSTDGLLGLSPIRQARQALGLAQNLAAHADTFVRNAGRPSGIINVPGGANQEALERVSQSWQASHMGAQKAGSIAILSGDGVQFTPLALSLQDAEFVAQRNLSTAEVCRIFRIPSWMLGAASPDSMTYSNVESQALAFVTWGLRPWLVLLEQAISEDADLCPGALYVEFLLDALLRGESKTRADVYSLALDPVTGWMNRDEVRRLENLDPEPSPTVPAPSELIA